MRENKHSVDIVEDEVWIDSMVDPFEGVAKVPMAELDDLIAALLAIQQQRKSAAERETTPGDGA